MPHFGYSHPTVPRCFEHTCWQERVDVLETLQKRPGGIGENVMSYGSTPVEIEWGDPPSLEFGLVLCDLVMQNNVEAMKDRDQCVRGTDHSEYSCLRAAAAELISQFRFLKNHWFTCTLTYCGYVFRVLGQCYHRASKTSRALKRSLLP